MKAAGSAGGGRPANEEGHTPPRQRQGRACERQQANGSWALCWAKLDRGTPACAAALRLFHPGGGDRLALPSAQTGPACIAVSAPSCTASIAAARQARWLAGETPAPRAIGCRPQRGGRAQRLCTGLFLANAARKRPAREGVLLGLWPAQHSHARCDTPEILRRAANVNPAGVSLQCLSAVRRVAAGQGGPQQSSHA
ncbi:hypothetical protein GTA08_BOTSDO05683 [Botryosphaeria dothidea]|uniref:Uncharacterized protein n=1 Tax=Botryosphaeria dothidea TaxID=55169 RepID=A0A8H4ITE4_9PEZI|nr:hypothetical protein GTA08_BOTSDO05683 [Botryosphaeria dothidea]